MKPALQLALGLLVAVIVLAGPPAGATSYTNTIAQMTAYLNSQMSTQNVQGLSIALVDDQTVVWAHGFGQADREAGVAADADTVYHVGSVSKAFLGTAFMQLLDQGQVNLELPLISYIPEFSMLNRFTNATPVTIRSLLCHQAGVPGDFFNGMVTLQVRDDYEAWLISYLQSDYPFAPVNERVSYCNSGFSLLTDVVRRITGTNFAAFSDARIFAPLGMSASSFLPDKAAISNRLAAFYSSWNGERQPPEVWNALGSGSLYSSVNDLSKYIRLILADGRWEGQSLVSSNGIDVMTAPQQTNLPLNVTDNPQGLGWDDVNDYRLRYAGKVFWKDGATFYHCAFLGISRDLKLGVAVIQNTSGSLCDEVGFEALRWAILDKTGQHWLTNTFGPASSPITNRPQAELDALAGLYVGSAGYSKIEAGAGTLAFIYEAHTETPSIGSNLVPRANGWFSKTNSQDVQLAFTNLGGHAMLVLHQVSGAYESVGNVGEYYVPGTLAPAWAARTNRVYRMVDLHPSDYFWYPGQMFAKTLRLKVMDGALAAVWQLGTFIVEPQTDTLAFQRGVNYRKGGAIQVAVTNGVERLQYSSYLFLDEAAIPTLPVSSTTNGSVPFANGTQWYWFTGQTGQTYQACLTAPGQNYFLRITDREGYVCSSGTNGPATFACTSNATYAVAVCATNAFDFAFSLTLEGISLLQADYDGDGKADPALYRADTGAWYIKLSMCGYGLATLTGFGGAGYSACQGDFDGDGKADPAVYQAATGNWYVKMSGSGYAIVSMAGFGGPAYQAVAGDYDGDSKADPAIYDMTSGDWQVAMSGQGYGIQSVSGFGGTGYTAVQENYDSDTRSDAAIYNQANGNWTVLLSAGSYLTGTLWGFGGMGYAPVSGDFDGDGRADPAIYEGSTGNWYVKLSESGYAMATLGGFGGAGYMVSAADYDGDGKADPTLFETTTGKWHIKLSASGYATTSTDSGYTP